MDEYIDAVLRELYLPQAVKAEAAEQLQLQKKRSAQLGESEEHMIRRLGTAQEVAERYNRNYRKGLQKKLRAFNWGIAALVAVIVTAGGLGLGQLYRYTKDQLLWYQLQVYQSQLNPFDQGGSRGGGGTTPFSSGGGRPEPQQQRPFGVQLKESYNPTATVNFVQLATCTAAALGSLMGINYLVVLKSKWKGYTLYLPPSMEE